MKAFKVIGKLHDRLEEIALVLLITAMIIMNFANVVCRYLLPQTPFSYTEELTLVLFVWATMIGISYAFKRGSHTSLTLITDRLPPRIRRYFTLFTTLLCVGLVTIMIWAGFNASLNQISHSQIMSGLKISAAWQSLAIPIGGLLILVRSVEAGVRNFIRLSAEEKTQ